MVRLDNGQVITYLGGIIVSVHSALSTLTFSEVLSTVGLVVVISRFAWDVYRDKRDRRRAVKSE